MALKSEISKNEIKTKKTAKATPAKAVLKEGSKNKITKADKKPKQTDRSEEKKTNSATKKLTTKKADQPKASSKKEAKSKAENTSKKSTEARIKPNVTEENFDLEKSTAVKEGKAIKNGKFDIRRAKDGRFFFCLYASNYAVVAYSQIYSSSAKAIVGINSVIANCPKAPIQDSTLKKQVDLPFPKWEIYIDNAGEYRFRLYATNGLCVCHSAHGYSTKSGCKGGIDSIKRFSQEAIVDKSYLN